MANLLPPEAKRSLIIEYWLRVITVWFILIALAFLAATALKMPTFVLVQSQLGDASAAYDDAREKKDAFNAAQTTLNEANQLSALLATDTNTTPTAELIQILDTIAGSQVRIGSFQITKTDSALEKITVTGMADTRLALANFSNDIKAHPMFLEADLPISNLAKDRDIAFNIVIVPSP